MLRLVGNRHPKKGGSRYSIVLADQAFFLTYQSFIMLTHLAVALKNSDNGWLDLADNPFRGGRPANDIYRLQRELRDQGNIMSLIENSRGDGAYRLTLHPDAVTIRVQTIIDGLQVAEGTLLHQCLSRV